MSGYFQTDHNCSLSFFFLRNGIKTKQYHGCGILVQRVETIASLTDRHQHRHPATRERQLRSLQFHRSDLRGHHGQRGQVPPREHAAKSVLPQRHDQRLPVDNGQLQQKCRDLDDSQCVAGDGTVTLPEADTEACNMEDVNQSITSEQVQKAVQKAVLKTVSKTNLNQALQQMAKATVSNFNAFQMSQAISNSNQQLSMQTKVSNNIAQTCGSSSTQSNSVYQQCGRISGGGVKACNIKGLTQSLESKATQECLQNAAVNNSVMQEARQKAEQTSVSKAIGVKLFSGAILIALLAFLGTIVLAPVISGAAEGRNRALALQSGVDPGMPKTKAILLIGAALLAIAGAVVWVVMAQRDVGTTDQEIKAGYLTPGYMQEQPLATIFPDSTYFPNFDYDRWATYMDEVRTKCKGKDGKVDEECFQNKTTFEAYCNNLDRNTCTKDPLGQQICGWEGGGANPTCTAVSGMLGKIRITKDEADPKDLLTECQNARKLFHESKGKEGYDCVGWRWKRKPGFPSNLKLNTAKRETDGWFADWISGSSDKTCDREKCQQSGYDPTDPACQNCCTKDKWPVVTDLCGALKSTDCKGSKFYPPIWYFAVRLGLQVEQRKRLPGQEKIVPRWRLRRLPLQELLLHGMWGGVPKGVGFTGTAERAAHSQSTGRKRWGRDWETHHQRQDHGPVGLSMHGDQRVRGVCVRARPNQLRYHGGRWPSVLGGAGGTDRYFCDQRQRQDGFRESTSESHRQWLNSPEIFQKDDQKKSIFFFQCWFYCGLEEKKTIFFRENSRTLSKKKVYV